MQELEPLTSVVHSLLVVHQVADKPFFTAEGPVRFSSVFAKFSKCKAKLFSDEVVVPKAGHSGQVRAARKCVGQEAGFRTLRAR